MNNRIFLICFFIWGLFSLVLVIFQPLLFDLLWVVALIFPVWIAASGLGLILWGGVNIVRNLSSGSTLSTSVKAATVKTSTVKAAGVQAAAVLAVILLLGAFYHYQSSFSMIGHTLRFSLHRSSYEAVVAELEGMKNLRKSKRNARADALDQTASVEWGPPLRVAFLWGGIIDNWCGAVHDPSGIVMNANRLKPDYSNFDSDRDYLKVKGLFGGDMISCRLLADSWYHCCFT